MSDTSFVVRDTELETNWGVEYYHLEKKLASKSLTNRGVKLANLGDIVTIKKDKVEPFKEPDKLFNYLSLANVSSNTGELVDFAPIKGEEILSGAYHFEKNDVLFARLRPYLNKVYLARDGLQEGVCSTEFFVLKIRPDVDPLFLSTYLRSDRVVSQTKHMVTGNALPRLTWEDARRIKIPIPTRPVQDRMVWIMEEASRLRQEKIRQAERLVGSLNEYVMEKLQIEIGEIKNNQYFLTTYSQLIKSGRFDPYFYQDRYASLSKALENSPFPKKQLRKISRKIVDGPFGSQLKVHEYVESGVPLIRVQNVKEDTLDTTNVVFITEEKQKQLERSRVNPGDVVLTKAGTIGLAAVVPDNILQANITSHLAKIEVDSSLNPYFLTSFFNTLIGRFQIEKLGRKSTRPELNLNEVSSILIPLPPLPVQNEIADEVHRRRSLAAHLRSEADEILESAKDRTERIILGEDDPMQKTIMEIVRQIAEKYNPEKIILYGSYAWGVPREESDIDLFIIKETQRKFQDRIIEVKTLLEGLSIKVPIDPRVYTPKEVQERQSMGDQFIKDVLERGEILHVR